MTIAKKTLAAVFWVAMIAAPLVIVGLALLTLPPGTQEIPMQVGFDGHVNRWAPPEQLWLVGGTLAGANVLIAACYFFSDFLYDHGMVHGISQKNTRPFLMVCGIALVGITIFCVTFLLSKM